MRKKVTLHELIFIATLTALSGALEYDVNVDAANSENERQLEPGPGKWRLAAKKKACGSIYCR